MVQTAKARRVAIVLYDDVQLLDVAGPADVFVQADRRAGGGAYEVIFVAAQAGVRGAGGLTMTATPIAAVSGGVHTLIVPGGPVEPLTAALADEGLLGWINQVAGGATRVVSICSGAFLLGALGLLDGHRATTHWVALDRFAARFPNVRVEREALFVEDRRIWTSAGVASGIDLALAMVGRDLGPDIALQVARDLVLHLVRPGGQSQFSGPLSLQTRAGPDLARLIPWMTDQLDREVTVASMAQAMGMSERSFHRRCLSAFQLGPARLLSELRLDRARSLLCDPACAVQEVAGQCGFKDAAAFSSAFLKRFGASPAAFRRAFTRPTGSESQGV
ncbi:GlxA family transcriptional regulator [Brevundimonas sp. TWP2-3-4b1]|uniref:GlxA family transcriptional regulator n=1 Tax=Brevundimonas sp. TWP2-3-4b1 TaxID=2804580 RepID=UPI003CFB8FB7